MELLSNISKRGTFIKRDTIGTNFEEFKEASEF